jgi:beta-galactosidase
VHILPNWNRDGQEGKPIEVWVYSNCDAVELFRDSRSLGRQAVPRGGHLVWQVTYAPGTLLAKGYKAGKIAARDKIETSGPPAAIRLTADRSRIVADGQDVSLVTVSVVDAHGRPVPKAENQVELAVTGGKIIGVGNGDPRSCESDKEPRRKVFRGLAQAIVKAGRRPSRISLCAASPGLTPAVLAIRAVRPVRPRPKA